MSQLNNQTVLFTGKISKCDADGNRYTRSRLQELAENAGAEIAESFTNSVTMLVTAEMDSTSSKMTKAKKLVNTLWEKLMSRLFNNFDT